MPGIFWNISNHPHARAFGEPRWSLDQIEAAESWGQIEQHSNKLEIRDIPFPEVDPRMDGQDIQALADELLDRLMEAGGQPGDPVHVMGELTLTYALVVGLKRRGMVPLASTTSRDTQSVQDTKISRFRFVRFREYPER